jgi:hypothetical protein
VLFFAVSILLYCAPVHAILISEVMYHPQTDEAHGEWVEIYNETAARHDLSGWRFTAGIDFTFPPNTTIESKAYLVIAADPNAIRTSYSITNVVGPFTKRLNNNSDHIILCDNAAGIMAEVDYADSGKWPAAADGAGFSLAKKNLLYDSMDPDNWGASAERGGSPGRANGVRPVSDLVINEVGFNTSGTHFIEVYNRSALGKLVTDHYLSNDPDNLRKFALPNPTLIMGNGRVWFSDSELGFRLDALGERVFLSNASGDVIDAYVVEPARREMTEGRWPDGQDDWFYMNPTTGTANTVELTTSVVINEIMYHPPTDQDADEFIELYNAGSQAVDLTGWSFTRGVSYDFTTGTTIDPGQYRVIAKDAARLMSRYAGLTSATVIGSYQGNLDDGGERVRLRDRNHNPADDVVYSDGGHWSRWADGYGSSLEVIDPRQHNGNYQNWTASDETSQSQWTFFTYTMNYNAPSNAEMQELQLNLMSDGVTLIDDIRITRGATNYLASGDFEAGQGSWLFIGNHVRSSVTTEDKHGGTRSLKIVSTGRGDTGANHIENDCSPAMPAGAGSTTVSFWARWLWGNRVLCTRTPDNLLSETHMLPIPLVTGTPGRRNTAYRANLGPVFSKVRHAPVVPNAGQAVTVAGRIYDPDGVTSAILAYKADSDGAYLTTPMYDDGAHGDTAAGDGIYGAQIPTRAAGQTVAFYLRATDGAGTSNTWPTDPAAPALYRVESGLMSSQFQTYRMIMTSADYNLLFNRPHLSNEELNCTFIHNELDVYYNCTMRFIGSPFHRSTTGYTGFKVTFNNDEKFLGFKDGARVDNNPGYSPYHDKLSYDMQRWMGLPSCQTDWATVRVNANNQGNMEDILPPASPLYLDMFYRGNSGGGAFEVDDRFTFNSNDDMNFGFTYTDATFQYFGPDKDVYRHNYEVRNHDNEDDYTSIILMLQALNTGLPAYTTSVTKVLNVEQWFKLFAIRMCISDWDFIAGQRGKNCYLYWSPNEHHWDLFGWDSELTFETGKVNMSIWSQFGPISAFQAHPPFRHYYFHYIKLMLDKHFTRAKLDPWIDHYSSKVGGSPATEKTFIDGRRTYLQSQISPYISTPVAITTNNGDPFAVTQPQVLLQGTAPVQAYSVRVGGVEYALNWSNVTVWNRTFPLSLGPNNLVLEFLDDDKQLIGTDSIVVTYELRSEIEEWKEY